MCFCLDFIIGFVQDFTAKTGMSLISLKATKKKNKNKNKKQWLSPILWIAMLHLIFLLFTFYFSLLTFCFSLLTFYFSLFTFDFSVFTVDFWIPSEPLPKRLCKTEFGADLCGKLLKTLKRLLLTLYRYLTNLGENQTTQLLMKFIAGRLGVGFI